MNQITKPINKRFYLNGFMLYHMLGHLWLDGNPCPWPEHKITLADSDKTMIENAYATIGN